MYGAGATRYYLVTGHKPEEAFLRSSEDEDPLTPPSALDFSIVTHIEAAWLRALSVRPQDRWPSVEALQAALAAPTGIAMASPLGIEDVEPDTERVTAAEIAPKVVAGPEPIATVGKKPPPPAKRDTSGWLWGAVGVAIIAILVVFFLQMDEAEDFTPDAVVVEEPQEEGQDEVAAPQETSIAGMSPASTQEELEPPPPAPESVQSQSNQPDQLPSASSPQRTPSEQPIPVPAPPRIQPSTVAGITSSTVDQLFTREEADVYKDAPNARINLFDLRFSIGRATFRTESHDLLGRLLQAVSMYPGGQITIEGHTDAQGNSERNLELSQARAEAIQAFLIENLNLDPDEISAVGHGESKPVADNSTSSSRAQNRRFEIAIEFVADAPEDDY